MSAPNHFLLPLACLPASGLFIHDYRGLKVIDKQLIDILRCPQNHSKLSPADQQLVSQVNRAIDKNHLVTVSGHVLDKHLDGGLIRAGGDLMYPIFNQIPVMLPDEAIDLTKFQEQ